MASRRYLKIKRLSLLICLILFTSAALVGCGGSGEENTSENGAEQSGNGDSATQEEQYYDVTREKFEAMNSGSTLEQVQEQMGGEGKDSLGNGMVYNFISEPDNYGNQERITVFIDKDAGIIDQINYEYELNYGNEEAVEERRQQTLDAIEVDMDAIREERTLGAIKANTDADYLEAKKKLHDNGTTSSIYAFGQGQFSDGEYGGYALIFYLTDGKVYDIITNNYLED